MGKLLMTLLRSEVVPFLGRHEFKVIRKSRLLFIRSAPGLRFSLAFADRPTYDGSGVLVGVGAGLDVLAVGWLRGLGTLPEDRTRGLLGGNIGFFLHEGKPKEWVLGTENDIPSIGREIRSAIEIGAFSVFAHCTDLTCIQRDLDGGASHGDAPWVNLDRTGILAFRSCLIYCRGERDAARALLRQWLASDVRKHREEVESVQRLTAFLGEDPDVPQELLIPFVAMRR